MSRAKPTEGPLKLHQGEDYLEVRQDTRGMFRVIYTVHYPNAEDVANARLFIAAHDMAAALKAMLALTDDIFKSNGIGKLCFQDYANLNEAPLKARAALKNAGVK